MIIGLACEAVGYAQPMTAQFDRSTGPIWFFGIRKSKLASSLTGSHPAMAHYVAKGHDLLASVSGTLQIDEDKTRADHFWKPEMAAWYEGGRDDADLVLIRLDCDYAKIWLSALGIALAIKSLLYSAKDIAEDQGAEVQL